MKTDHDRIVDQVSAIHRFAVGAPGDDALDALMQITDRSREVLGMLKELRDASTGGHELEQLRKDLDTVRGCLERAAKHSSPLTETRDAIVDAQSHLAVIRAQVDRGGAFAQQLADAMAVRGTGTPADATARFIREAEEIHRASIGTSRLEELRKMVDRVASILGDAARRILPQTDTHNAITDARCRVADIASYIHGDDAPLAERLADVVAVRNVGSPLDPEPYPATTGDVAAEILKFIDGDGAAAGIRQMLREQLEADAAREAAERHRERIASVMRDVATQHLYPALRDLGIDNPEDAWELRGKWREEVPGD